MIVGKSSSGKMWVAVNKLVVSISYSHAGF